MLQGVVKSASECLPISEAFVELYDKDGNLLESTRTNTDGYWTLSTAGQYIQVTHKGYSRKTYSTTGLPPVMRLLEATIIGYCDQLWTQADQPIAVKVHSVKPFTAKLVRLGKSKEFILSLGSFKPCVQTVPDNFFVEQGLDWSESFTLIIPEHSRPGIYNIVLADGVNIFAIPLVVSNPNSNPQKSPRLLVLASTNTWQQYNFWGGRSRYRNFEQYTPQPALNSRVPWTRRGRKLLLHWLSRLLPAKLAKHARQLLAKDKIEQTTAWEFQRLSVKRPFPACDPMGDDPYQPFTSHLTASEWRLLAWLEREGYDYDIISGFDWHQNPDVLQHYSAIILSSHCEYWSADMYHSLTAAHQHNGLWVVNLSGNSIYRLIEFAADGSTICKSVRFRTACADETQTLGVRYTPSDYGTCAAFKILRANHPLFKGCNQAILESGTVGNSCLNRWTANEQTGYNPARPTKAEGLAGEGASGWETDKLSHSAPDDFIVIAKGMNFPEGADMVYREPNANRGGVFSASSITFAGSLLVDEGCSIIVKNVLERATRPSD